MEDTSEIVDWHLGIRLGLSVAHWHACFRIDRRSCIDVYEQVAWHKSQIVHIAWRLSAIRQTRRSTENPFSFLERPVLALSSPVVTPLAPLCHFSSAVVYRSSAMQKGPAYRELNGGFRKNGKSLRACQSDVRGFAPIWLMMIHCSISLESRASAVP